MRSLAQPEVLKSAGVAALATSLASYPRLALWPQQLYPIWYLEGIIFLGSIVLWGFVFAWHTEYTARPVFALKMGPEHFAVATTAGIFVAIVLHLFLQRRLIAHGNYPRLDCLRFRQCDCQQTLIDPRMDFTGVNRWVQLEHPPVVRRWAFADKRLSVGGLNIPPANDRDFVSFERNFQTVPADAGHVRFEAVTVINLEDVHFGSDVFRADGLCLRRSVFFL
jgi:hypothetical protein